MKDNSFIEYLDIANIKNKKLLFLLIDPDDFVEDKFSLEILDNIDALFIGGSLITSGNLDTCLKYFKERVSIPIIIFPGNHSHISNLADGILLLSLISGRNPDLLIGNHVSAAFLLKKSKLKIIPTGYILVDGGKATTVSYISNTQPIPYDKPQIATATALAGEQLGLKLIYMDTGSGAINPVSEKMIQSVKGNIAIPLIIGGGIKTLEDAKKVWLAGATGIVIGTAAEKNPEIIYELNKLKNNINFQKKEKV